MDPASRATASEAWNLVSMLPYIHSSHSNLVVILSCFKSTLREMQWDLLVIASLWMKLLLFQVYMMLMLFCFLGGFFCSHRETASPDRLWSGVGFRLDDRVYEEDRVTKFLQQQQAFPRCTLSGIDSLHSRPLSPLLCCDTLSLPFLPFFLHFSFPLSHFLFSFCFPI